MYKILEEKAGEVTLEIEVNAEKLKRATDIVMGELGKSVKIAGFRPGKAPQFMVEKEIGSERFWAEVMDKAIPEVFFEAIIEAKITALTAPQVKVKEFVAGEKLVFDATVAVLPEIKD
jgi:trigger factor